MEIAKLAEWNPWWERQGLVDGMAGIPRPQYREVVESAGIREITIITGIRRSGKSTLMYQIIQHLLKGGISPVQILFVNLEDKKMESDSLDDMYLSYREQMNPDKKAFIFLDEIHRKKGWEAWIRKKYDLKTDDKFIISGSSSYLLRREYSTLLTGRNISFEVFPLSFEEFLAFKGREIDEENLRRGIVLEKTKILLLRNLLEYLRLGGFPEIMLKQDPFRARILEQYFDDILYKDIVDRYQLNSQKAKDLAVFFATNITGFISLRSVRNALELSYDTIKDYLAYFKEAFLFFTIDHFSYSFKEQKTLPSKIYCIDTGLRNAVSFMHSRDEGKLAENVVCVELKRRHHLPYYWKKKGEIDFVIKGSDQSLTAINVTYTDEIPEREVASLREFKSTFKKTGTLVLITKNIEKKEKGIAFVPLWKWLLEK